MLARRRDILLALDLKPEQHAEQQVERVAEKIGGQVAEQQDRCADVERAESGDQHGLAQAHKARLQQRRDARSARHENGIEHIVGGDGAGAPVLARPGLEGGEQRHGEQAAGQREAKHVKGDAQAFGALEKIPHRGRSGIMRQRRNAGGGKAKVDQKARHRQRGERHRQQENAAMADDRGKDGADADADGENGVDGGFNFEPGAEPRLQQHRHQRQRDRAGQPEPAHAQRAGPLPQVAADFPDQAER